MEGSAERWLREYRQRYLLLRAANRDDIEADRIAKAIADHHTRPVWKTIAAIWDTAP